MENLQFLKIENKKLKQKNIELNKQIKDLKRVLKVIDYAYKFDKSLKQIKTIINNKF